jgi:TolA-binding protein
MRLLQAAALLEPSTERTTFAGLSAAAIPARVGWAMPAGGIVLAALVVLGVARSRTPASTESPVPTEPPAAAAPVLAAAEPGVATTTAPPPPEAPASPPPPPVRSSPPRAPAPLGHRAPQPVVPAETAKPAEPAPPTFAAGVGSMEQGNFGEAIDRLGAFRRGHPDDLRSEDAAFLMIVALQRAGRRRDAVAAAREYLSLYPSGYRRTEAQSIVAHGE